MGEAKGNATEAARIAGYANPKQQGSRLLTFVDVQVAIAERQQADPLVMTREDRQRFWSQVARGELSFVKQVRIGRGEDSAIVDIEVVPEFSDRLRAAELLGKASGDFVNRVDHTTQGEKLAQVVVYLPNDGSTPGADDE